MIINNHIAVWQLCVCYVTTLASSETQRDGQFVGHEKDHRENLGLGSMQVGQVFPSKWIPVLF